MFKIKTIGKRIDDSGESLIGKKFVLKGDPLNDACVYGICSSPIPGMLVITWPEGKTEYTVGNVIDFITGGSWIVVGED